MYLKALEMRGFKSFPEKTRLTFEKAVTAIVGPNGSGKSNIADAIQWGLGEQSTKTLRSGKMEDVIFGGTEKRNQVGYAEVALIFDNTDGAFPEAGDELEITRRYYRSGDSEYTINKRTVRLKDVNELLMDTGIGRDGYGIIGQGKIDAILSAKSTDRREIFEEAAGISRYRHRKESAERELQHAEENLTRVNDKIGELELQVGPLREQAETAKKYLLFRDELRGLEISLWLNELEGLAGKNAKLEADSAASAEALEQARAALEKLYAESETFAQRTQDKDIEAERLRGEIAAIEERGAEAEAQAAVLNNELKNNLESIERVRTELREQEGRDSGILAQIEGRQARMAEIESARAALMTTLEAYEQTSRELDKTEDETAVRTAALSARAEDTAYAVTEKKTALSALSASLQEAEDKETALLSGGALSAEKLTELKRARDEHLEKLKAAEEERDSLNNVVAGLEMRMDSRRKKAEETADKQARLTMDRNTLTSRIAMLAEMEKEYEGYSGAVKTVMREAGHGMLRHIHGPAGELLKTDDAYALAIETAMGAGMQNIIVDTEEDGKAAISLLKRQNAGRVTFLPLAVMKGTVLSERGLEREEGFEGLAIDLIRFDEKYRGVYTYLIGRTAVADDLNSAVRIARKYGHRFRIVTLDGQVINAGGSMTGGSVSKNVGILSRANEIKTLREREARLAEELAEAVKAAESAKRELDKAEYELEVAREEVRAADTGVVRLTAEREQHELLVAAAEESAAGQKAELKAVRERTAALAKAIEETKQAIASLEQEAAAIKAEQEKETGGLESLSEKRLALMDKISAAKADKASLEAERDTLEKAIAELGALRSDLLGGRERQEASILRMTETSETLKEAAAAQEKEAAHLRADAESRKKRVAEITQEKLAIEAERTKNSRESQDMNGRLIELERENARIEQRRQAAVLEEKQILDKLWDTYELSRSAAMQQRIALESVTAARRRAAEIKRGMSALGTPNLGAIEEFERVNTRYTYLTEQRDDIERSRTEILGIIGEITGQMKDIFAGEFERIDKSFQETFTELFGGGRASLQLEDPDDILDCGIDIKVQPPGKSLRTITLLSGGEKAFVAIALYFAILKVKPTPFVVMDEIDAALDEVNVSKYTNYMRSLSDRTQFLTITHRRGTMESSDVLYGVTMQEKGVSRIIKVDVDEAEKTLKR